MTLPISPGSNLPAGQENTAGATQAWILAEEGEMRWRRDEGRREGSLYPERSPPCTCSGLNARDAVNVGNNKYSLTHDTRHISP